MDYCSSCRRTLNGALVCPGCGAYAPDIAPPALNRRDTSASAPARSTTWDAWHAEKYPSADLHDRADRHDTAAIAATGTTATGGGANEHGDVTAGIPEVPDTEPPGGTGYPAAEAARGTGRAARRRQLARWKKNRRRATVASAVALVGGGLSLAMPHSGRPSAHHAETAAMPEPVNSATARTDGLGSSGARPDDGHGVPSGTGKHRRTATGTARQDTDAAGTGTTKNRRSTTAADPAPVSLAQLRVNVPDTSGNSGGQDSASNPKSPTSPSPSNATPPSTSGSGSSSGPSSDSSSGSSYGSSSGSSSNGSSSTSDTSTPDDKAASSPVHVCLLGVCVS